VTDYAKLIAGVTSTQKVLGGFDYVKLFADADRTRKELSGIDYSKLLPTVGRTRRTLAGMNYAGLISDAFKALTGPVDQDHSVLFASVVKRAEAITGVKYRTLFGDVHSETAIRLLPSWRITSGMALTGATSLSLAHDLLGVLHTPRAETVAFETVAQAAEAADSLRDTVDRLVDLFRRQWKALIDLAANARDEIQRAGLVQTLVLLLAICSVLQNCTANQYAADQTRYAMEQTQLAQEQTALARAAASDDSSAASRELSEHIKRLEGQVQGLQAVQTKDAAIRGVTRVAPLRTTPSAKGTVIGRIWPDEVVRVKRREGNWVLVDVFDYKAEAIATGWVYRSALKIP
jgi:hypothetical protein